MTLKEFRELAAGVRRMGRPPVTRWVFAAGDDWNHMITVSRRDYHVAMLAAQTKMDGRRRAKGLEPLPRYELALIEAAPVASPMYRNRLAVERIGKRRAQQAAWRRRNREKLAAKSRTRRAKLKLPRLGYANAD